MQHISSILQQNIHLIFLQCLFICLCNLYFFSKLVNKKFLILSAIFSLTMSILYIWLDFYTIIFIWLILILFNQIFLEKKSTYIFLYPTISVFLFIFSDYVMEIFFQTFFQAGIFRVILNLTLSTVLAILMKNLLMRISSNPNSETFKRILCAFLLFTVGIY